MAVRVKCRCSTGMRSSKFDHITPLLRDLHWLRIPERITFRLAVLAYRCQHGSAPPYLAGELQRVADIEGRQRLRSASKGHLTVPATNRATIGDRAFPVAAARAWNSLPSSVTSSPSLPVLKKRLKLNCSKSHFLSVDCRNCWNIAIAKKNTRQCSSDMQWCNYHTHYKTSDSWQMVFSQAANRFANWITFQLFDKPQY